MYCIICNSNAYIYMQQRQWLTSPESGVVKLPSAGGLLPYSLMACTDQLYCVLCWRWGRGREVAVMLEKGREVEVLVTLTV